MATICVNQSELVEMGFPSLDEVKQHFAQINVEDKKVKNLFPFIISDLMIPEKVKMFQNVKIKFEGFDKWDLYDHTYYDSIKRILA